MPRNRGITGEQWSHCDQCGFEYPISQLQPDDGLRVCERCVDDDVLEIHPQVIAMVLAAGQGTEGTDQRFVDESLASFAEEM